MQRRKLNLNHGEASNIELLISTFMSPALLIRSLSIMLFCAAFFSIAVGQAAQYTNNSKDQSLRGSGRVNESSLATEFSLPLGNYPGRGINIPINLSYSSKVWRLDYGLTEPRNGGGCYTKVNPKFAENSVAGWTTSLGVPYIEYTGSLNAYNQDGEVYYADTDIACDPGNNNNPTIYYVRRVTLHLPSGETHELRMSDTAVVQSSTWNGTYYAADGSNIKYIEDSANSTYKIQLPDGSFYDLDTTATNKRFANKFTDRNGNYTTYHAPNSTYPKGYWTDTLGRIIPIPITPQAPPSAGTQDYLLPGISGNITYKLHWKQLKGSNAESSGLTNFSDSLLYMSDKYYQNGQWYDRTSGFMFGSQWDEWIIADNTLFNPIVLSEIELPTGEKYKFTYNVYGEIERIYYPTGSEERFVYNQIDSLSESLSVFNQSNRGVSNRKVYETAGTGTPSEWDYDTSATGTQYIVTVTNPNDTKNVRFLHRGNVDSLFGFDNALAGMPYREFSFTSAGVLQTQKFIYWTKSTGERHPRVLREESIIYEPSGSGLSSTAIYEYEGDLSYKETPVLTNKMTVYAFETASGGNSITPTSLPTATPPTIPTTVPPTPLKIAESVYLINDTNYSSTIRDAYKNQNMIGLTTESVVKDGSGTIVAKNQTIYDESGSSPAYRGNPTTAKVWDSTKGAVTSSGAYIATHAEFDSYGNLIEATDALGNTATTTYDSTYHAFPITVTGTAPDTNGVYGSNTAFQSSVTYNTTTGLPLTTTDINGQTTTMAYDATTLRPTSVTAPNGHITEYIYGEPDSNGVYTSSERFVKIRTQIDANNWKEGLTWLDGLGRAIKGQSIDSNGDVFAETEYDIMGRVKRSTNPYKTGDTKLWTTPTYDDWGRVVEVTSPDTTKVEMSYGISTSGIIGITKTVTDQAGKKRKGISDALGRMIRVIEDPTGQNLATDYVFDTLGNLRKTTQGDQTRYFMHDSLGRLLYAKQVEQDANSNFSGSGYTDPITNNNQWSVKYVYDDNGNITSTTDARGKTISATYDHLNRLIVRDYSDTSMADVSFYYDGKGLSATANFAKGKLTKMTSSVSETRYKNFDNMGRLLSHEQITDGQTYTTSYIYNLSGALIEETYPSTRVVKNTLNEDGELSMVQSKKNSNYGYFAYAFGFDYNTDGSLKKMRLGNGNWETFTYNNRFQVTQIGLGTTDSTQNLLKLEFAYGVWEQNGSSESLNTDKNNGSLAKQIITVPTVGNDAGFVATQKYKYDALNRLSSAEETISSSQTWKQTFSYDRYGNRRFDATNTTTLGSCTTAVCNPTISTSNNRFSSGQGYSYDADGNLTQDGEGKRFGYDSENRQKEFFFASNSSTTPDATYYYDGEGNRVKKISSTEITIFVYDGGGQLVEEYSTALAQTQQVSYLTTDHLGSPRIITNENGVVTKRQDFAAFGDETITSARTDRDDYTQVKEIRQDYTGYQKDEESGLEYAQARYYNTQHGRFTSVDPLTASATIRDPQSFNRYSYVLNSPYKFTDPLGLLPLTSAGACGQWCQGTGPQVDGSAFRGRDATFDHLFEDPSCPNCSARDRTSPSSANRNVNTCHLTACTAQKSFIDSNWQPVGKNSEGLFYERTPDNEINPEDNSVTQYDIVTNGWGGIFSISLQDIVTSSTLGDFEYTVEADMGEPDGVMTYTRSGSNGLIELPPLLVDQRTILNVDPTENVPEFDPSKEEIGLQSKEVTSKGRVTINQNGYISVIEYAASAGRYGRNDPRETPQYWSKLTITVKRPEIKPNPPK